MPPAQDKLIFGRRVRQLRSERGWSQEEFAHLAGLDRSYMGGVERGERNISLENICLIAIALGVSPAELFADWPVPGRQSNHPPARKRRSSSDAAETPPPKPK